MKAKNQHALFYALLAQMPYANKEEIVFTYSDGLTTSLSVLKEVYPGKYEQMIESMKLSVKNGQHEQKLKRHRNAVLVRMRNYGIDTSNLTLVNDFLLNKKIAGKKLYELSIDELKNLIKKMEILLKKKYEISNTIYYGND